MLRGRTTTEVGPATVGSFAPCSLWLGALTHLSTPQGTHEYVQVPKRRASARPAPPHEHATGCGHGGSKSATAESLESFSITGKPILRTEILVL